MDPSQFQSMILAWVAALTVAVPAVFAFILLIIRGWIQVSTLIHQHTAETVAKHEQLLNGGLDARIDERAKAVAESTYAHSNAGGPPGAPGPGGGSGL